MKSTDDPRGMAWQSLSTAAISPAKVRLKASPPKFPVAGGTTMAAAQQQMTKARGARLRKPGTSTRRTTRDFWASQEASHTASRSRPGSTAGTRRRLAYGWWGVIAGWYRKARVAQPNTRMGSTQTGASPFTHRRPSIAKPTTANAMVENPVYQ